MTTRMVTYRVKEGRAEENSAYVRDVMADLEARRTEGVTYSVYLLDDGVSFLHVADEEGDGGKLQVSEAFQRFTATLVEDRCAAPPGAAHHGPGGELLRVSMSSEGFAEQVAPLRPGLLLHCYRMLASSHDAEDAVQETLLRGWRGVERFEGRSSLRTWLYTVATNVCLREIERRGRRLVPVDLGPAERLGRRARAARRPRPSWLGPLPDAGLTWGVLAGRRGLRAARGRGAGVRRCAPAPAAPAAGGAGVARRAGVLGGRDRGEPRHDRGRR